MAVVTKGQAHENEEQHDDDADDDDKHDDTDEIVSEVSVDLGPDSSAATSRATWPPKKTTIMSTLIDDIWPCHTTTGSLAAHQINNNNNNKSNKISNMSASMRLEQIDPPPTPCHVSSPTNSKDVAEDDQVISVHWPSDEDSSFGDDGNHPNNTTRVDLAGTTTAILSNTTKRLAKSAANFFLNPTFDCSGVGFKYCASECVFSSQTLASRDDENTVPLQDDEDDDGRGREEVGEDDDTAHLDGPSVGSSRAMSIGSSWTSYEALGHPLLADFHYYRSLRNCNDSHTIARVRAISAKQQHQLGMSKPNQTVASATSLS
jgi:hypothetical protein